MGRDGDLDLIELSFGAVDVVCRGELRPMHETPMGVDGDGTVVTHAAMSWLIVDSGRYRDGTNGDEWMDLEAGRYLLVDDKIHKLEFTLGEKAQDYEG